MIEIYSDIKCFQCVICVSVGFLFRPSQMERYSRWIRRRPTNASRWTRPSRRRRCWTNRPNTPTAPNASSAAPRCSPPKASPGDATTGRSSWAATTSAASAWRTPASSAKVSPADWAATAGPGASSGSPASCRRGTTAARACWSTPTRSASACCWTARRAPPRSTTWRARRTPSTPSCSPSTNPCTRHSGFCPAARLRLCASCRCPEPMLIEMLRKGAAANEYLNNRLIWRLFFFRLIYKKKNAFSTFSSKTELATLYSYLWFIGFVRKGAGLIAAPLFRGYGCNFLHPPRNRRALCFILVLDIPQTSGHPTPSRSRS